MEYRHTSPELRAQSSGLVSINSIEADYPLRSYSHDISSAPLTLADVSRKHQTTSPTSRDGTRAGKTKRLLVVDVYHYSSAALGPPWSPKWQVVAHQECQASATGGRSVLQVLGHRLRNSHGYTSEDTSNLWNLLMITI